VGSAFGLEAAIVVLATPFASWWLIGDLSERAPCPPPRMPCLDYVAHAPDVPSGIVAAAGAVALFAALVAFGLLARGVVRAQIDRRYAAVVGPLVFAGVLVVYCGRVLTAGVHGANIGAGLAVIFGVPMFVIAIGVAVGSAVWIRRNPVR
jgi:hypothetical protein